MGTVIQSTEEQMKVSVLMPTYNHEPYIAQAIESFLAQQCDFAVELLIGNDASTDNTLEIARQYAASNPERIKLIDHKTNIGLLRNYKSLIDIAQGEYFAILESDDYWIDPLKLQKQVDFLDQHPSYGISYTQYQRLRDGVLSSRKEDTEVLSIHANNLYERFLLRNIIKSPTVCFRRSMFERYCNLDDYIQHGFRTFDFPVWLSLIRHSNIHYIPTPTSVYRFVSSSISNSSDLNKKLDFEANVIKIRRYLISKYGSGRLSIYQIVNRETIVKGRYAYRSKEFLTSLGIFIRGFVGNGLNYVKKEILQF